MNLSQLRGNIRDRTGYPERGTAGKTRLNSLLNHALRQLRGDMPEALLREEFRFRTDKVVDSGTVSVLNTDPYVFLSGPHAPSSAGATYFTEDYAGSGTYLAYRARWIDIQKDSVWYQFRIKDLYKSTAVPGGEVTWKIVIDKPWINNSDTGLAYKVYTYEYPYPGDTIRVRRVILDPEGRKTDLRFSTLPDHMASLKIQNGWKGSGTTQVSARGDFYQLEPPHYTPIAAEALEAPDPSGPLLHQYQWGYSGSFTTSGNTLAEQVNYGVGGSFSYIVAHVWGRRRPTGRTQEGKLFPFYISAYSAASATVSTKWGGPAITVQTPDIDYVNGYGPDATKESYHHNGVEKWIFRARHSTNPAISHSSQSGSNFNNVEEDSVYYLWRITPGHTTETIDRGDDDPVDRNVQLLESTGHYHVRFDYLANKEEDVLLSLIRRPHELVYDTDSPRIPPEAVDALIYLTSSMLLGERDGNPERMMLYKALYTEELGKLRSIAGLGSHVRSAFGDGLSGTAQPAFIPGSITEG